MTEPTFDDDGYPTEETLRTLEEWPGNVASALDFLVRAWHWPDWGVSYKLRAAEAEVVHAKPHDRFLRLATGGWSGNESLIDAFGRNSAAWSLSWELSASGGLHIFRLPRY